MVVLPVHVASKGASQGDELRAGRNRREEPPGHEMAKQLEEGNPRLALQNSGARIEGQEPVQALHQHGRPRCVVAGIAVAPAEAPGQNRVRASERRSQGSQTFRSIEVGLPNREPTPPRHAAAQGPTA